MATNSYKVLGQIAGTTSLTDLYSVPNGFRAFASVLALCNQSTTTASVRVAVRPAAQSIAPKHYILYDAYVNSSDTLNLTLGLSLGPLDIVSVSSSQTSVSALLSGSELVIDATTVASVYNIATAASVGMVRPDNTSISVTSGILSLIPGGSFTAATTSNLGAVRPDNTSLVVTSGIISASIANASVLGIVKPDGTSILVTSGVISANINIQTGSASVLGIVKPDGTSILVTSGVISANVTNNVKTFCNWYYSGGIVINSSSNVSSITYNGVGNYTINFKVPLPTANYVVVCSMGDSLPASPPSYPSYIQIGTKTVSSVIIYTGQPLSNIRTNFNSVDYPENNMVIFN